MTEKEKNLLERVNAYMASPVNPAEPPYDRIRLSEAGDALMQYAPGRYRMLVRRAVNAPVVWSVKQLNDAMGMLQRQLASFGSVEGVKEHLPEIVAKGEEALRETGDIMKSSDADTVASRNNKNTASSTSGNVAYVPQKTGRRSDHDRLPAVIRALYEENLSLLQKQRSLFERMKLYAGQLRDQQMSGAAPCDIEETSHMLQETAKEVASINDKRLENWYRYDSAEQVPEEEKSVDDATESKSVSLNGDALRKLFNNNQNYISRYSHNLEVLADDPTRKVEYETQKQKLQKRVDELLAAGWAWPEESKSRTILSKHGLKV